MCPICETPTKPSSQPSAQASFSGPGAQERVRRCQHPALFAFLSVLDMKLDPGGLGWREFVLADSFLSQARGFVMEHVAVSQALLSSSTQLRPAEDDVILAG